MLLLHHLILYLLSCLFHLAAAHTLHWSVLPWRPLLASWLDPCLLLIAHHKQLPSPHSLNTIHCDGFRYDLPADTQIYTPRESSQDELMTALRYCHFVFPWTLKKQTVYCIPYCSYCTSPTTYITVYFTNFCSKKMQYGLYLGDILLQVQHSTFSQILNVLNLVYFWSTVITLQTLNSSLKFLGLHFL